MGERVVARACAASGCRNVVPEPQVLCDDHGGHPTPAPTAALTVADFERREALVDDTFPHTHGVTPPLVMHRRGRLMVRLVEFQMEVEQQAIARHREQADAEVARLRAAIPADPWLMWNDGGNGDAFYQCYRCYSDESQGHNPDCAWLATRPPTPSPEQGA